MNPQLPLFFTPLQAVAWIMFRDAIVVSMGAALPADPQKRAAELARSEEAAGWIGEGDKDGALTLLGLDLHAIERLEGPAPELPGPKRSDEASALLVEALRNGSVTAQANHRARASFEPMPAVEWTDLTFDKDPRRHTVLMACFALPDGCPSYQPSAWLKISIDRGPLMAAFPARQVKRLWPAPSAAPEPAAQDSVVQRNAASEGVQVYSGRNLMAWFIHRVATWPKGTPFPNRDQDKAAAERYFGGKVPPDEFRRIREERTPPDWRKRGRRGPLRARLAAE